MKIETRYPIRRRPPVSQKSRNVVRGPLQSPTKAVANAGRDAATPRRVRNCTTSDHAEWGPPDAGDTPSAPPVSQVKSANMRATGASGRRSRTTAPRRTKRAPVTQREILAQGEVMAPAGARTRMLLPFADSNLASRNGWLLIA